MICSISTGKCGSSWLDRLRSTKGFPTADGLDLDHFLLTNDDNNGNHNPNSPDSTQSDEKRVGENRKEVSSDRNGDADDDGGESEWLGIMSSVLSDLFNMGGETDRCRRKKSSRKQSNPRICVVSTVAEEEEDEEGRSSSGGCERKDENAPPENANANNAVDCGGVYSEAEEEGEFDKSGGGERELFGFSRNEVTVIDTSCAEWKFEKLVYRRRNVWRVREKKGKSKIVGRKRRKGSRCDANADGKKRAKVSSPEGECVSPSKPGQSPEDDKTGEVGKGTSDDLSQVPKRRASLSRLRKKSKKGGSSVVIKGSPTSNKSKSHKSHRSNFEFKQHEILCNKPLLATLQKGKEYGN